MKYFTRHAAGCLLAAVTLLVVVTLSVTSSVRAENYPNRDITFINPYAPGGSTDPLARQFAKQLEKILGGHINVENKPGGSAMIGTGIVVRAKPDGYTIGLSSDSCLAYQPLVNSGLDFKTPDDYQPIVKLTDQYVNLIVRADAPWKTFNEFMDDVRKNPGKIRASVSAVRGINDLVVQQFNKSAGVKITTVPFTGGGGEALLALLGGRVEANAGFNIYSIGQARAGKIRVLAVFKKGKDEMFPDATSVVDAGYNVTLVSTYYVIAPKGMPKDVVDKLVSASLQVVRSEEYLKFAKENGFVGDAKGPAAVKEEIIQYIKDFSDLIKYLAP